MLALKASISVGMASPYHRKEMYTVAMAELKQYLLLEMLLCSNQKSYVGLSFSDLHVGKFFFCGCFKNKW